MRRITLSADEHLIDAARQRALADHTTLDEQFRLWLADYAHGGQAPVYEQAMTALRGRLSVGRKLTRDEMNER